MDSFKNSVISNWPTVMAKLQDFFPQRRKNIQLVSFPHFQGKGRDERQDLLSGSSAWAYTYGSCACWTEIQTGAGVWLLASKSDKLFIKIEVQINIYSLSDDEIINWSWKSPNLIKWKVEETTISRHKMQVVGLIRCKVVWLMEYGISLHTVSAKWNLSPDK